MADQYSTQGTTLQGVSINNDRRKFNFGDRVVEIAPKPTPFFSYLSKHRKVSTNDPVFKFQEQRHQALRRNMRLKGAKTSTAFTSGTEIANMVKLDSDYDIYGREVAVPVVPKFVLGGQIITLQDTNGVLRHFEVGDVPDYTGDTSTAAEVDLTPLFSATCAFADNAPIEITGSSFAEGTGVAEAWKDELYNSEGYCQIFKTAIPMFSGTSEATELRGRKNEYKRTWLEKIMEHKADLEKAFLFGVGTSDEGSGAPKRRTWGILPYTEANGKVYSDFTYGQAGWDKFLEVAEDFFEWELGNLGSKLVLCSRKIATWLNKTGAGGYLQNTVGENAFRLDFQNITGEFGHQIMQVKTMYGNFNFVINPWLRGPFEDYAVAIDMKNVAYRPLVGNGKSRDTFLMTNVQDNDVDARQDMILTEAGLEIALPETHAILKFS
tara:strand:+ start:4058 stop:5365 length:1308 start_codon:yes stop_codon:yes gene_type:complete